MAEPLPAPSAVPVRVDSRELARRAGWTEQYVRARRLRGLPPKFVKLGTGKNAKVMYDLGEIERFEASRTFSSTTEAGEAHRATG